MLVIKKERINQITISILLILALYCWLSKYLENASGIAIFFILVFLLAFNFKQIRTDVSTVFLSAITILLSAVSVLITRGALGSMLIIWNFILGLLVLRHLEMGPFNKFFLLVIAIIVFSYFAFLSFTAYKAFSLGAAVLNPNNVAVRLAASYILIATIFRDKGRIVKIIILLLACFAIFCSLNCECRTALMMILVHLLIYFAPKRIYNFLHKHYKVVLSVIAILSIAIPMVYVSIWRQNPSFSYAVGGGNGREMIWSTIFEDLSSEPFRLLFGVGTLFEPSFGTIGTHNWYIGVLYLFGIFVFATVVILFFKLAATYKQKYAMAGFLAFIILGMAESAYLNTPAQMFVFAFILCCQPLTINRTKLCKNVELIDGDSAETIKQESRSKA